MSHGYALCVIKSQMLLIRTTIVEFLTLLRKWSWRNKDYIIYNSLSDHIGIPDRVTYLLIGMNIVEMELGSALVIEAKIIGHKKKGGMSFIPLKILSIVPALIRET
jgi:hypothetical protein